MREKEKSSHEKSQLKRKEIEKIGDTLKTGYLLSHELFGRCTLAQLVQINSKLDRLVADMLPEPKKDVTPEIAPPNVGSVDGT